MKNMDIASTRQFIISRWECCLVGREHISRQALAAELAAGMMVFFYVTVVMLPLLLYSLIIYLLHISGLISFTFIIPFVDIILWGFCLYLMIALGLFLYAELIMLIKDCRFTVARVSFFVSISVLLIIFYAGYVLSLSIFPSVFYDDVYHADEVLELLTFLCLWMLLHFGGGISINRFVLGEINKLREAEAAARTLKYYVKVDLLFVVIVCLSAKIEFI